MRWLWLESQFSKFDGPPPLFYKRYVDDCFLIFENEKRANDFFEFVNTLDCDIKFTYEKQIDNSLDFLDTCIKTDDNSLEISWKLKETNTGLYIPNKAHAPKSYKLAAMRSLFNRARRICSSNDLYVEAVNKLTALFEDNGYSKNLINIVRSEVENRITSDSPKAKNESKETRTIFWKLPYSEDKHRALRSKIKRINKTLQEHEVKIKPAFKTLKTKNLFQNKDAIPPTLKSEIVYSYECGHCNSVYVGETSRHLITRIQEHLHAYPVPSEISLHNHDKSPRNFKVISSTPHHKILESIVIAENDPSNLLNKKEASIPLILNL